MLLPVSVVLLVSLSAVLVLSDHDWSAWLSWLLLLFEVVSVVL
jgi:hypothetical protein